MSSVVRARVVQSRGSSQQRTNAPLPIKGRGVGEGCEVAVWPDLQRDTLTLPSPLRERGLRLVECKLVEGYSQ
jgi:hypothetical protein